MEKVLLILQLLHPYTFIPTSTVIRAMRVLGKSDAWQNIFSIRRANQRFIFQIDRFSNIDSNKKFDVKFDIFIINGI